MYATHEQIAEEAYRIWLEEGCPEGRQTRHWLMAEDRCEARGRVAAEAAAGAERHLTRTPPAPSEFAFVARTLFSRSGAA